MILDKIKSYMSHMMIMSTVFLLMGCAAHKQDSMSDEKGEFARQLSDQYTMLSRRDANKNHRANANFFKVKAMHAARGEKIAPEDPRKWSNVPEEMLPGLIEKRNHLVSLQERAGCWKAPREAAAAQAGFDCMISEFTSCGCCGDEAGICRELFENNIKALEILLPSYVIQFEESKWALSPEATQVVTKAADAARQMPDAKIHINGFTDGAGERKENIVLSQNRANEVAKTLTSMGIESHRIHSIGKGEIPGAEVSPENRKVVVYMDSF